MKDLSRILKTLIVLFSCSCAVFLTSCIQGERIPISGKEIVRHIPVGKYSVVETKGNYSVSLIVSDKDSVVCRADSSLMPYLKIEKRGKHLVLDYKKPLSGNIPTPEVEIYSSQPIEGILLSGASKMSIAGTLKTETCKIRISGASNLEGDIVVSHILDMQISGASRYAGNCIAAGNLAAEISGASGIHWEGFAKEADIKVSGASHVQSYGMSFDEIYAEVSGASSMKATVSKMLDIQASGSSKFIYKGQPEVNAKTSGASAVKPAE